VTSATVRPMRTSSPRAIGTRAVAISELLIGLSAEPMNSGVVNRHENGCSSDGPGAGGALVEEPAGSGRRMTRSRCCRLAIVAPIAWGVICSRRASSAMVDGPASDLRAQASARANSLSGPAPGLAGLKISTLRTPPDGSRCCSDVQATRVPMATSASVPLPPVPKWTNAS
jgi:hypothetical protein